MAKKTWQIALIHQVIYHQQYYLTTRITNIIYITNITYNANVTYVTNITYIIVHVSLTLPTLLILLGKYIVA